MRKISKNTIYYKTATPSSIAPKELHSKSFEEKGLKPVFKSTDLDKDKKTYTFVGTKEVIDRDGDIVLMDGIDFTSFKANPVVLWGHDSREMPVGKVVGIMQDVSEKTTLFDIQFASTAKGQEIEQLVSEGILKATSIGFMVKDYEFDEKLGAFKMTEIEIFEISVCNIPANQDALLVEDGEKSFEAKDIDIAELARQVAELINQEKPKEPETATEEPKEETGTETQDSKEEPATEPETPDEGKKDEGEQEAEDKVSEDEPKSDKTDLKLVAELLAELVTQLNDKGKEEEEPQEQPAEEPATEDKPEEAEEKVEDETADTSEEEVSSEEKGDNDHSEEQEPNKPEEITEIDDLQDEITYVLAD